MLALYAQVKDHVIRKIQSGEWPVGHRLPSENDIVQQLGMSLGVAAIGTVFFGALGADADRTRDFLQAAQQTTLITVGLVAVAALIGFLLPKRARSGEEGWSAEPALA